jgi:hypothetical protein
MPGSGLAGPDTPYLAVNPARSSPDLIQLQQTHGNAFVQKLVNAGQFSTEEFHSPTNTWARRSQSLNPFLQPQIGRITSSGRIVLQRTLNYLAQVTGDEARPFLEAFDRSVATIDREIRGATGPEAADLREALASLRSLRTAGRVTCWHVSGGLYYASYDNASGQLRLHVNFGSLATVPGTLIHEAIHAVHAGRYPRLSRLYARILAAGGTRNESLGILLLKWKAWTEYWAYRRAAEYRNLRLDPADRIDAHRSAIGERDVMRSIRSVELETGRTFAPWDWSPPARYLARSRRRSSP